MNTRSKDAFFTPDLSGMAGKVMEFPAQLRTGWEIGKRQALPWNVKKLQNLIYAGMGGSAIAGDLIRSILTDELPIPFTVKRGYELPPFAGKGTLFIASSYSGNTEETLSVAAQAVEKKCSILCMTSGGKLAEMANEKKYPLVTLPKDYPPRAALGFSLGTLLNIFPRLGAGVISDKTFIDATHRLERLGTRWSNPHDADNQPYAVARSLMGKAPLIYADTNRLEPVGFRWKTHLNENSKTHAFFMPMPEMNHNEIIGWEILEGTKTFFPHLAAVLLRTPEEHPRVALRMEITKELIDKNGGTFIEIKAEGNDFLDRLLYLVWFGDWVSLYLALSYGADPTEINNINYLKNKLNAT
jgi:glucose/mannose-6-phosphate isomerase